MIRSLVYTSQFKRDYKKRSREKNLDLILEEVLDLLMMGHSLDSRLKDHFLKGGYSGCRECHLKPDLLLIYILSEKEVRLVRLGSHSELFD